MRLFQKLIVILFLIPITAFAAECDPPDDLNSYVVVNGNYTLDNNNTDIAYPGMYVKGDVTIGNKAIFTGSIYATGNVIIGNKSKVTEDVWSGGTITLKPNADILGVTCENVKPEPPIDLPVDELIGQCTDIFPDAVQSYNSTSELFMQNTAQILDSKTNLFPFGSIAGYYYDPDTATNGNPPPNSCGAGVSCGVTSPPSQELSDFSIVENNNGVSFSLWNSQVIELGGTGESDTKYNATIFENIIAGSSSEITFLPLDYDAGLLYQVDSLTVQETATVKLSAGVYAIHTLKLDPTARIEVIGDGDVFLFVENIQALNGQLINSNSSRWFFIVNSNLTIHASNSIDALLYSSGDITLSGFTLNGQIAAANVFLGGNTIINYESICGGEITPPNNNYSFSFDGLDQNGLTCSAQTIPIKVLLDANVDTDYSSAISLSTSTNLGDWSIGDGQGSLTNNGNGKAEYNFSASDNGTVNLALFHPDAGDVVVTVAGSGATIDSPIITFRPFKLQAALSCEKDINGDCINIANRPFSLTLTAIGEDTTTGQCQVVEGYTGTKELQFWSSYVSPTTPVGVDVEVEGDPVGKSANAATLVDVAFSSGVSSTPIAINYPDTGQIQIHARDDAGVGSPPADANQNDELQGSTSTIVNPLELQISDVTGYKRDAISAGTSITNPETSDVGSGFIRSSNVDYSAVAVDTFDLTVTAVKDCTNDSKGHCNGTYGTRTPSFSSTINLQPSLVFPSSGTLGNLQYNGTDGYKVDLTSGEFVYQNLAYDEVGTLGLIAKTENDYLVANNEIESSAIKSIGRFYPDYLAFNGFNVTPACNSDYTYIGQQDIEVNYSMIAYAQGGQKITVNYDYNLGYPVAAKDTASGSFSDQANTDQTLLSLSDRLLPADYYQASSWIAGQHDITGLKMGIAKTTSPEGPYFSADKVNYFIQLTGKDGEKIQMDSTTTCAADSCFLGDLGDLAYGRLQAGSGHGSEFQAIRTDVQATYYDGTRFVNFTRDVCTAINLSQVTSDPVKNASNDIQVSDPISNTSGTTKLSIINSPLIAGKSQFNFSAPDNRGELDYFINLETVAPWLLDPGNAVTCSGESGTLKDCISGHVAFGLFRGNDRIIYRLQTFN
ncbi:hypothetical protein E2R68_01140 [Psychromonas sp. RZ22]|uniref:DUF6701 domain-containing protein n=1 Tax=Psychromonas algarum TaxID=2555643 RepID=UPI0010684955|nr:DUF6701 domain-containing protein [Psychromonas sp. RZ22]TEW56675.1 hypothetical protein E2R68_01140 [Psychromonas sp. RZ22]